MENKIKLPILIIEDEEFVVFNDLAEAESLFRLHDIGDTNLKFYDGAGNVLLLRGGVEDVEQEFLFLRWKVQEDVMELVLKEPVENHADVLREQLIDFIETMNTDGLFSELDELALPDLIDIAEIYTL